MYSVLEKIPHMKDEGAANKLLAISSHCSQQSLNVFADTQDDVEKLMNKGGSVTDIFNKAFVETPAT